MTIQGINVQGNGLGEVEIAERVANLESVLLLEEHERARRIHHDRCVCEFELRTRQNSKKSTFDMEASEQLRREMDIVGEEFKKELAHSVSALVDPSHSTLRKSAEMMISDLSSSVKDIRTLASDFAVKTTLSATEAILDKAHKLGEYAYRAVEFFGVKVQDMGDAALQKGEILGAKAADKAQELKTAAVEQSQIVGAKAVELGAKAIAGAQSLGQQLGEAAIDQAQQLGDAAQMAGTRAIEKTEELMQTGQEKVQEVWEEVNLTFAYEAQTLSWDQLTLLEELERNHRMKDRLAIEGFLLALQTSDLIKDLEGYRGEPNRWYATAVLEEFERKRRFLEDRVDHTSLRHAHTIAYFVLTHFRFNKALPAPVIEPIMSKKQEIVSAPPPVTGLAAM